MNLQRLNITTKYKRDLLVQKLEDNYEEHKADYVKAKEVYQSDLADLLSQLATESEYASSNDDREEGEEIDYSEVTKIYNKIYGLKKPIDASKMYEQYIELISQSAELDLELTLNDANAIINDDWDWAVTAKTTNSSYSSRY